MIIVRPQAARELAAEVGWYRARSTQAAQGFKAALDEAIGHIEADRLTFPILREPDVRSARVFGYPHRVVYLVVRDDVHVIAVAHAKRQPGYWAQRL